LYVLSAPLWHSRQGHHRSNIFDVDRYPWIHLRFDEETLKRMCETGQIEYRGSVEEVVDEVGYMMNPAYFNKRPARDYVRVGSQLKAVVIERNDPISSPNPSLSCFQTTTAPRSSIKWETRSSFGR
jgi:hypothetical protein